jgi:hypothetical protein
VEFAVGWRNGRTDHDRLSAFIDHRKRRPNIHNELVSLKRNIAIGRNQDDPTKFAAFDAGEPRLIAFKPCAPLRTKVAAVNIALDAETPEHKGASFAERNRLR